MRVVVTGGRGFLGSMLARRVEENRRLAGSDVDEVVVIDRPDSDVCDEARVGEAITDGAVVFHLASMVSGECERDFDAALRVNLGGGRNVLEVCRARGDVRLVLASTLAVYGGSAMPARVTDETRPVPQTTYGMTKLVLEALVADFTRKGFLDGRAGRLPTVIVRPGPPNTAASGFASALFREPLAGIDYALPVGLDTRMPLIGARTAVAALITLAEVDSTAIGDDRVMNLPSISASVGEMLETLGRFGAGRTLGRVTVARDPEIEAIVRTWPAEAFAERALALGAPQDESLEAIVEAYLDDFGT